MRQRFWRWLARRFGVTLVVEQFGVRAQVLRIETGDSVIFYFDPDVPREAVQQLMEQFNTRLDINGIRPGLMIAATKGFDVDTVDEAWMRDKGWVKLPEDPEAFAAARRRLRAVEAQLSDGG